VLIVKRATLNQIATDPTVVIFHSSYATNASDATIAASEIQRMASDLSVFANGLQTGNLIFIITSLGCNPGFNLSSLITVVDMGTIDGVINNQLGGAGDLTNLGSNGYYSIIGSGRLGPALAAISDPDPPASPTTTSPTRPLTYRPMSERVLSRIGAASGVVSFVVTFVGFGVHGGLPSATKKGTPEMPS